MTHPILDVLTPYGTQLLAPFSDQRFAINAMSIIDPVYTGVLVLALIGGWAARRSRFRNQFSRPGWSANMAGAAIVTSAIWQGYAWSINNETERVARMALAADGIETARVISYPTLSALWGIEAQFDGADRLVTRPTRFSNRPDASTEIFTTMWVGAFGE